MDFNWIGVISGLAAFLGIWIGHVSVRKIEAKVVNIWAPAIGAWSLGVLFEAGALLSENLALSAVFGILGVTLLWDGLEFLRQQKRIVHGHAPANPENPRHKRILETSSEATTVDWLNRSPAGRPVSLEELRDIQEALT